MNAISDCIGDTVANAVKDAQNGSVRPLPPSPAGSPAVPCAKPTMPTAAHDCTRVGRMQTRRMTARAYAAC